MKKKGGFGGATNLSQGSFTFLKQRKNLQTGGGGTYEIDLGAPRGGKLVARFLKGVYPLIRGGGRPKTFVWRGGSLVHSNFKGK